MSSTTQSSAGIHAAREPTAEEKKFIDDVLDLYQLKPNDQAYSHYSPEAVFHDPVSIARGLESIKSQFNGMPKVFAESTTEHVALLDSSTPASLELNLTQRYVFKSIMPGKSHGKEKTVNSKITFKRNDKGLITEHIEEWDHESNKTGEDGFFGKLQEARKKLSAKLVEKAVPSDPNQL